MTNPITAADSIQSALESKTFDSGNTPDAGALAGTEMFSISRGTSTKLQTTLTKLATWAIGTFAGFTQSGTGGVARTVQAELADYLTPMQFGAKADGVTDDTAALNATYAAARLLGRNSVNLRGKKYMLSSGGINATGVSTIGEGGNLIFQLSSANSYAFSWGGNDNFVTGVIFDLSNSTAATAIQGIINSVNNVENQSFFNNRVIAHTSKTGGTSANIYGAWFTGTGLLGVKVYGNHFRATGYAVQINNQTLSQQAVLTAPIGNPSKEIHIYGNTCVDASIGVNTPGIFCTDVVVAHNTVDVSAYQQEMPINIAHVQNITVSNNVIFGNVAGGNGVLHIEDATGALAVTGNVITALAIDGGILLAQVPGVSGDNPTVLRAVITGNHIYGAGTTGTVNGIVCNDTSTINATISGNFVKNFANGINGSYGSVIGNTIENCGNGLVVFRHGNYSSNKLIGCTTAFYNTGDFVTIHGGLIENCGMSIVKNAAGGYLFLDGVEVRLTGLTITSNTAFDVLPLPTTNFNGTVTISFGNGVGAQGYMRATIAWNGTTFTPTTLASAVAGTLGTPTLTLDSGTQSLAMSMFVSGSPVGSATVSVNVGGLVY